VNPEPVEMSLDKFAVQLLRSTACNTVYWRHRL